MFPLVIFRATELKFSAILLGNSNIDQSNTFQQVCVYELKCHSYTFTYLIYFAINCIRSMAQILWTIWTVVTV